MADVAASPNDPIFINHHAMVDCIFEEWLKKKSAARYPDEVSITGHRKTDYIVPFFPLFKHNDMFQLAENFGYSCSLRQFNPNSGSPAFKPFHVLVVWLLFVNFVLEYC